MINTIKAFCAEDATIIHGTVFEEDMGEKLRVTVVATGIGKTGLGQAGAGAPRCGAKTGTTTPDGRRGQHRLRRVRPAGDLAQSARSAVGPGRGAQESGVERLDIPAFLRKQAD